MSAQPTPAVLLARPMRADDLDAVLFIERSVYPFPWTRANFVDSLAAGYDAWVAEAGDGPGPLVGYWIVMHAPDVSHLLNISVSPHWQGRGWGARLLERACGDAAGRGAPAMLLEVRPSNEPALRLYQRHGFGRVGLRRRYYPAEGGAREDAIVMMRPLDGRHPA